MMVWCRMDVKGNAWMRWAYLPWALALMPKSMGLPGGEHPSTPRAGAGYAQGERFLLGNSGGWRGPAKFIHAHALLTRTA